MPLSAYVNVWRLIEMFSSICNILRFSVSMITLRHSLLMQPRHFAIAYLFLYPYTKKIFMGKSHVFQLSVLWLSSFCGTRKEVRMEIREAVSFYRSRVKYVTFQELLTNSTRSLTRDSNIISKQLRVIKTGVKFELSCTVHVQQNNWW